MTPNITLATYSQFRSISSHSSVRSTFRCYILVATSYAKNAKRGHFIRMCILLPGFLCVFLDVYVLMRPDDIQNIFHVRFIRITSLSLCVLCILFM